MLRTLVRLACFHAISIAVTRSHSTTLGGSEDSVQVDVEDRSSCVQEASISLLQSKVEVVKSSDALSNAASFWPFSRRDDGDLVWRAFDKTAKDAREKLVAGSAEDAQPASKDKFGWVFSSVDISLPVAPPIINHVDSPIAEPAVMEDKNIVKLGVKPPCVVYGMGIAPAASWETPRFEEDMAKGGCEVHAFDCSVRVDDPNVINASFSFHPWCIGKDKFAPLLSDTRYVAQGKVDADALKYKSLQESMSELGHTKLSLLKFDIEGFEWPLFEDELFSKSGTVKLPEQMSFELHTEGANPSYVSPDIVKGKGFAAVNNLFLTLFDMGYRVVSKEINNGDDHCAEFVVVHSTV